MGNVGSTRALPPSITIINMSTITGWTVSYTTPDTGPITRYLDVGSQPSKPPAVPTEIAVSSLPTQWCKTSETCFQQPAVTIPVATGTSTLAGALAVYQFVDSTGAGWFILMDVTQVVPVRNYTTAAITVTGGPIQFNGIPASDPPTTTVAPGAASFVFPTLAYTVNGVPNAITIDSPLSPPYYTKSNWAGGSYVWVVNMTPTGSSVKFGQSIQDIAFGGDLALTANKTGKAAYGYVVGDVALPAVPQWRGGFQPLDRAITVVDLTTGTVLGSPTVSSTCNCVVPVGTTASLWAPDNVQANTVFPVLSNSSSDVLQSAAVVMDPSTVLTITNNTTAALSITMASVISVPALATTYTLTANEACNNTNPQDCAPSVNGQTLIGDNAVHSVPGYSTVLYRYNGTTEITFQTLAIGLASFENTGNTTVGMLVYSADDTLAAAAVVQPNEVVQIPTLTAVSYTTSTFYNSVATSPNLSFTVKDTILNGNFAPIVSDTTLADGSTAVQLAASGDGIEQLTTMAACTNVPATNTLYIGPNPLQPFSAVPGATNIVHTSGGAPVRVFIDANEQLFGYASVPAQQWVAVGFPITGTTFRVYCTCNPAATWTYITSGTVPADVAVVTSSTLSSASADGSVSVSVSGNTLTVACNQILITNSTLTNAVINGVPVDAQNSVLVPVASVAASIPIVVPSKQITVAAKSNTATTYFPLQQLQMVQVVNSNASNLPAGLRSSAYTDSATLPPQNATLSPYLLVLNVVPDEQETNLMVSTYLTTSPSSVASMSVNYVDTLGCNNISPFLGTPTYVNVFVNQGNVPLWVYTYAFGYSCGGQTPMCYVEKQQLNPGATVTTPTVCKVWAMPWVSTKNFADADMQALPYGPDFSPGTQKPPILKSDFIRVLWVPRTNSWPVVADDVTATPPRYWSLQSVDVTLTPNKNNLITLRPYYISKIQNQMVPYYPWGSGPFQLVSDPSATLVVTATLPPNTWTFALRMLDILNGGVQLGPSGIVVKTQTPTTPPAASSQVLATAVANAITLTVSPPPATAQTSQQFYDWVCKVPGFRNCADPDAAGPCEVGSGESDCCIGAFTTDAAPDGSTGPFAAACSMSCLNGQPGIAADCDEFGQQYCSQPDVANTLPCACVNIDTSTYAIQILDGVYTFPQFIIAFERAFGSATYADFLRETHCWWPLCQQGAHSGVVLRPTSLSTTCPSNISECIALIENVDIQNSTVNITASCSLQCPAGSTPVVPGPGSPPGSKAFCALPPASPGAIANLVLPPAPPPQPLQSGLPDWALYTIIFGALVLAIIIIAPVVVSMTKKVGNAS
jgi:hypothetical protein